MEKHSKDLSGLGELVSTLVKTQSEFAENLRSSATGGVEGTQKFVEQFLDATRTRVDGRTAGEQRFLAEDFAPKFQSVAKALLEQGDAVRQLQQSLTVLLYTFFQTLVTFI